MSFRNEPLVTGGLLLDSSHNSTYAKLNEVFNLGVETQTLAMEVLTYSGDTIKYGSSGLVGTL